MHARARFIAISPFLTGLHFFAAAFFKDNGKSKSKSKSRHTPPPAPPRGRNRLARWRGLR
jgi:hypothetical protein